MFECSPLNTHFGPATHVTEWQVRLGELGHAWTLDWFTGHSLPVCRILLDDCGSIEGYNTESLPSRRCGHTPRSLSGLPKAFRQDSQYNWQWTISPRTADSAPTLGSAVIVNTLHSPNGVQMLRCCCSLFCCSALIFCYCGGLHPFKQSADERNQLSPLSCFDEPSGLEQTKGVKQAPH